jgi:hypothetical protein
MGREHSGEAEWVDQFTGNSEAVNPSAYREVAPALQSPEQVAQFMKTLGEKSNLLDKLDAGIEQAKSKGASPEIISGFEKRRMQVSEEIRMLKEGGSADALISVAAENARVEQQKKMQVETARAIEAKRQQIVNAMTAGMNNIKIDAGNTSKASLEFLDLDGQPLGADPMNMNIRNGGLYDQVERAAPFSQAVETDSAAKKFIDLMNSTPEVSRISDAEREESARNEDEEHIERITLDL